MSNSLLRGVCASFISIALLTPVAAHAEPDPTAPSGAPTIPVGVDESAATGWASLDPSPVVFFPGVAETLTGRIGAPRARPVHLEVVDGNQWRRIATAQTNPDGSFEFPDVSLDVTAHLRVNAPALAFIGAEPAADVIAAADALEAEHAAVIVAATAARTQLDSARAVIATGENKVTVHLASQARWTKKLKQYRTKLAKAKKRSSVKSWTKKVRAAKKKHATATTKLATAQRALQKARVNGATVKARTAPIINSSKETVRLVNAARRKANRAQWIAPWAISDPVTVTVQEQAVTIGVTPPLAQPGFDPAAAPAADAAFVNVRVTPARAGRTVHLETLIDGSWTRTATQSTDVTGNVVFETDAALTQRSVVEGNEHAPSVTTKTVTAKSFELDFEDTFDGSLLDASKWGHANRSIGTGLRSCAFTDDSSSSVAGGVFTMGVSLDPARASQKCAYTDGTGKRHALPFMRNTQVNTQGKYDFTYGFAAARMKVQQAQGMHSAFWSTPLRNQVPNDPSQGVEVDVMEYFGDGFHQKGIGTFIYALNGDNVLDKFGQIYPDTAKMTTPGADTLSDQYAVYSWERTPTEYVFRVDGREYHRTDRSISHAPQLLSLSNLTSSWEMVDSTDPTWSDTAKVDWVRTWKP